MRKFRFALILALSALLLFTIYYAYGYTLPKWFPFNTEDALDEWEEKVFKNRVLYSVEPEQEGGYLSAKSEQACSGLIYKIKFYPKLFPMISWEWKVAKFPKEGAALQVQEGWIEKDDYAARVYVIFPSWYFMHIKCIEYIWHENLAEETIMTSPYFDNIKLIVTESGRTNMEQWVSEKRNIYDDYVRAFGKPPSVYVGAIALMTDTDNTLSTAEAFYRNIKLGYKNE